MLVINYMHYLADSVLPAPLSPFIRSEFQLNGLFFLFTFLFLESLNLDPKFVYRNNNIKDKGVKELSKSIFMLINIEKFELDL